MKSSTKQNLCLLLWWDLDLRSARGLLHNMTVYWVGPRFWANISRELESCLTVTHGLHGNLAKTNEKKENFEIEEIKLPNSISF